MELEVLESHYPDTARYNEIDKILGFVKEGHSCQVIAMPGVGRGNLMGFLAYNRNIRIKHLGENQGKYHFVLANFSEIKGRPLFDAMKFIFLELASSLHERRMEDDFGVVDGLFKESLSYNDELVLFQGLKRAVDYLTFEKNLTIVFLFERFEAYIPTVTSDFFTNLRSIRNRAKYKFSIIFSTVRPLEEILDPVLMADFYEYVAGHYVFLPILDQPGMDFRVKYLETVTGKKIPEDMLAKLLKITAGHGKLTRVVLETILSQNLKSNEIDAETLLHFKTVQGALYEIWHFLSPSEQQIITSIVKERKADTSEFLENVGLIKNNTITISLFTYFVEKFAKKQIDQPLLFDSASNTIRKGETVISDMLTTSEFRLLKVLLENPDRVMDREEIISSVWKEAKTTAGVTNQAVDQLVFRLRKKLEEDPNNPQHIQTIKGRGIKFVQ